ncbi:putative Fe-S cluster assembly protein SufT [Stenotrophomonas maltophilia]|uniref:putative Fe-S cluster assembly protein SufT n=1 Tax=Stenotrophomonas maltophilia TaxID=40324 RepID=UPI0011112EA3|nr:putative Fe-S cluster assembly protein SufT [Stenotrophomonas maltophilia]TIK65482.1 putative Fe-S cluster assembly protein SufT [Stenotrophomonas maltophilia]
MYSRSSDPVHFERDCEAVMVPQGDTVTLPAGSYGYITQALGGSYSVFVEGNLFRIAGKDGDAIGKEAPAPLELPADATDEQVEQLVWQQLRTCFDPEIPVNIVELGLVYEVEIKHLDEGKREIDVKMTLTAPGCGMGEILVDDVRSKLEMIPTVAEADVDLVFDPPWNQHMMSEAARLETGML